MIKFILNEREISYSGHPGIAVLDFIRYHKNLTGTKIGCREGDCGACTVLVGEIRSGELNYRSMTSCLLPIGNVNGKHIVTVEGINMSDLNPIQQAMSDESATQCGFCTPGFVMSLAGFCLQKNIVDFKKEALASVDGNICRCTGYKSIERATLKIAELCSKRGTEHPTKFVSSQKILPEYFEGIQSRLMSIQNPVEPSASLISHQYVVAGGTDLYVQKHDELPHADLKFVVDQKDLNGIQLNNNKITIGGACTVTDLVESEIIRNHFVDFEKYYRLVSSTPIRNMATLAGNIVNASPIGDFTAFFLALSADVTLMHNNVKRVVKLKDFYLGYKKLNKLPEEILSSISFDLPSKNSKFNFEKVCKRTNLDIASVNTAISVEVVEDKIISCHLSAGGVGPTPLYLAKSSEFLIGKSIEVATIQKLLEIIQTEISPISDARGTEIYKRTLLNHLVKGHFSVWYPQLISSSFISM